MPNGVVYDMCWGIVWCGVGTDLCASMARYDAVQAIQSFTQYALPTTGSCPCLYDKDACCEQAWSLCTANFTNSYIGTVSHIPFKKSCPYMYILAIQLCNMGG